MIGRGTRLCLNLFGPGDHKKDFRIFDFCFNFEFFKENPQGIETGAAVPLGTRLFRSRATLLGALRRNVELDDGSIMRSSLSSILRTEVKNMNTENFIVKTQLESVHRFQSDTVWDNLSDKDISELNNKVAGLPSEIAKEEIESRFFDLTALRMQLALLNEDVAEFEKYRKKVLKIASALEEKGAVPSVRVQLAYLASMQAQTFRMKLLIRG